jgi:UDPglucose 6-dehydrogenase
MGLDNRIGAKFLHPGPGFGGSCFPKDTLALVRTGQENDVVLSVVSSAHDANDRRKQAMAERVLSVLGAPARGKTVAVLGLTFKPNTDDMREAPSLVILPALVEAGVTVRAYDPKGMTVARPLLAGVEFAEDVYRCAAGADALVILTEWDAFRALDLRRLKATLSRPVIVDLRNIYRASEMKAAGFTYHSVGRRTVTAD